MDRLVIDGWGKFIGTDHEQIIVKERKDGTNTVIHRCIPQDLRQVVISGKGSISPTPSSFLQSTAWMWC